MHIYIGNNWPADRQSSAICPDQPPPQARVGLYYVSPLQ